MNIPGFIATVILKTETRTHTHADKPGRAKVDISSQSLAGFIFDQLIYEVLIGLVINDILPVVIGERYAEFARKAITPHDLQIGQVKGIADSIIDILIKIDLHRSKYVQVL